MYPFCTELASNFSKIFPDTVVLVTSADSALGLKTVREGTATIGMISRVLTPEEIDSGLRGYVIAHDGVVIVVHNDNAVTDLTGQQIRDIFNGNITSWKDVGGSDADITVVTREEGSGTRKTFEELVMGRDDRYHSTMTTQTVGDMIKVVAEDKNAIGYISYSALNGSVKALTIDGVAPSVASIQDKSYFLQRPFMLVTMGETTNPVARAYIEYSLSPEGQDILAAGKLVTVR
jgi:phosphate transport system substrate-binding protein